MPCIARGQYRVPRERDPRDLRVADVDGLTGFLPRCSQFCGFNRRARVEIEDAIPEILFEQARKRRFKCSAPLAFWKQHEPEMEYQIADALRVRGHDVILVGVRNDLQYLVRCLEDIQPDLVFNGVEAFHGNAGLEYMVPGILEAEGYRYTGSPPLALLVSRNKAMSKKVLAYHGIRVPGFVTCRPGEALAVPDSVRFPLIVKPLQSDASAGIAQASVVQDQAGLADRVTMIHERFDQPAIAEEFVDGRDLAVQPTILLFFRGHW